MGKARGKSKTKQRLVGGGELGKGQEGSERVKVKSE